MAAEITETPPLISTTARSKEYPPGAIPLPSGCGPCVGLGRGLLGEDEVGISATNRNFQGRMGARTAQAYLASPAVVSLLPATCPMEPFVGLLPLSR